ncbi:GGDEF domain-containing protein [Ramlibacter algicola]|uniref:Diguanylate cyclase n=1 Tax=Ramlibacter algicola TaxID=2795217 RepID=A0A934PZX3_9BURK|nr:GGDEF domain-containing protein [Ramlibacter algicola]MBK0391911.1 diguanylate cyclase [Ramlibacter algicola]
MQVAGPWLLGAATGVLVLLALLSAITAIALRERALHVHAAACALAALTANAEPLALTALAPAGLVGVMAMAAMHARGLATQIGAFRPHRRAMSAVAVVLALLAFVDVPAAQRWLLLPAAAILLALDATVLARVWDDGRPWAQLVALGQAALLGAATWMGLSPDWMAHHLLLGAALAAWALCVFVATAWRSRLQGERRWQLATARHEDPITRLASERVLDERAQAARTLMRRFGHPTSVLLLHADELDRIAERLGPRAAEAAALEAGLRLRMALGRADVASRVGDWRFAVLSEGASPQEVAAQLAGRILVAGLKRPLHNVDGVFLHFRVVVAPLPLDDTPTEALLARLGQHLDEAVRRGRDRRIHVLDDPHAPTVPAALPSNGSSAPVDTH